MKAMGTGFLHSRGFRIVVVVLIVLAAVLALIAGTNAYTVLSTRDDVHRVSYYADDHANGIVVLGASVLPDGTPSDILADRLEVACDLYLIGAGDCIIVSGSKEDGYDEPAGMRDYCVSLGVPAEAIVLDPDGYDTYASIYNARYVFGLESVIVVTQAYHLYRALATAKGLGMEAYGVAADKGDYDDQAFYSVREIFSRTVDCIMTLFKIPPLRAAG